jgi:hypothetical protein
MMNNYLYTHGKIVIFLRHNSSKSVKIKIYKMMAKPAVVYGCETWAMAEVHVKRLTTKETKILRRITSGRASDIENKN